MRGVAIGTVDRVAEALGASVDLTIRWEGEQLDRLMDAGHAWIVERTASRLASMGWETRTEVSFNHYGDRGVVDLLALHPVLRVVLVVEAKTSVANVQDMLGRLDVKARLGRAIAESVGWTDVGTVTPAFVLSNTRTARREVMRHDLSFGRYAMRGRSALTWVREPSRPVPSGLLWFVNVPDVHGMSVTRGRRVRRVKNGP